MSVLVECGACHRDHLFDGRVPANWVCDGCRGVPDHLQSCGCQPALIDGEAGG